MKSFAFLRLIRNRRQVSTEEAMKTAKDNGMNYIETSAKTGKNVEAVFYRKLKMKIGISGYVNADIQKAGGRTD